MSYDLRTSPMLLCRTGSMTLFDGDLDTWHGGHSYPLHTGKANEAWNFHHAASGRVFGFVQNAGERNLRIERLGAARNADFIDGITIVWCSRHEALDDLVVHGWYLNARVYRRPMRNPDGKRVGRWVVPINFETAGANAILLPVSDRRYPVPYAGPNTLGHSDILYVDEVNRPLAAGLRRYLGRPHAGAHPPAPAPGVPPDQHGFGGGESPQHLALKLFVRDNPHILEFGPIGKGKEEHVLPSLDGIDVYFSTAKSTYAVEVKPRNCGTAEHRRGLFQCVKYRAILEAQAILSETPKPCVPVLVTEDALSPEHQKQAIQLGIIHRQIRLKNLATA